MILYYRSKIDQDKKKSEVSESSDFFKVQTGSEDQGFFVMLQSYLTQNPI